MDETLANEDPDSRHNNNNSNDTDQQHQQQPQLDQEREGEHSEQHHHHQSQTHNNNNNNNNNNNHHQQQQSSSQLEHQKLTPSSSLELQQNDLSEQQENQSQIEHNNLNEAPHSSATSSSSAAAAAVGAPSSSLAVASAAAIGSNLITNLRTNATNSSKPDTSIPEDLLSNKRWGTTPIRQDTPWELPPSPTQHSQPGQLQQQQQQQQQQQPLQQQQQLAQAPGAVLSTGSNPLAIPPGISQSGDSFHGQAMSAAGNNVAGLIGTSNSALNNSRCDQPWRAPILTSKQPTLATSASFANHNLMNSAPDPIPKSDLFNRFTGGNSHTPFGMQAGGDFARAPGPASSILDSNAMSSKSFGMSQRASTWSSFGTPPGSTDGDSEWPKSTRPGISAGGNSMQPSSNAFDLVHEFEPGKSWHGSNLMKGLDGDSTIGMGQASMTSAFSGAYGLSSASRSPTGSSQLESSGIGTWSPIVKGGRSGSMWDGDGQDGGRGEGGRFDDGTAIWGNPVQTKAVGAEWDKTGSDGGAINDKSRSSNMAGSNQSAYRSQQSSSSSASLLMSSNTSPSNQQIRSQQQILNKPSAMSHNFDQVQQQSNALSNQANQPNRGMGLSSNVPSKHQHQLTTMVQQIQLAVQAGHLNPQILNQPLAPVTLQLLYQLLQQIRTLHTLQMKFNQPGTHQSACSVQMNKTKQTIQNLQNQIAAQQAMHLKQTQTHNISSRQPTMPNLATGGMGGNIGQALPPGISQSGDGFRSGNLVGDFHGQAMHASSFGADSMTPNGLATSLSHMSLGGAGMMPSSRFDQPWRPPATKQHQSAMGSSAFASHNLMNAAPGGMQKSMLNPSSGNGGSSFAGVQQGGEFARAPGPASSMMDNNMAPKSFGMTNRSASTWSAFGNSSSNDSEPGWPKSTSTGISSGNATQSSNAFDLVPEFEPGKPWRGSTLMRSVEDDPNMTPGSMARSLAPQRKTIWSDEVL